MLNFRLAALAIAALVVTPSAGYTAEIEPGYEANVEHGLDLAKRWCASTKELEDVGCTESIYAALSRESGTKMGMAPSVVIYDELGQSEGRDLLDAMDTAMGKRAEPLMIVISTQASRDEAPLSQLIDYGLRIQRGEIIDPTFHLTLYSAPETADPWKLATWRKANPALGDF